ncbi:MULTISPECIES: glycosyltransferase [Actinosynnema]|uniref:glycosyltransferase n=1 Tax=Actinosynnema TaxID=40566 RepID=UPI0020A3AEEC|nr:glycosyltransferase [Actinosynnema pretiosum]MCP2093078.1 Glycosyltransferase, catalytic subunit of cellulose synthase and poly-beta-1,6-N-acetylglucosamine synthase [Actinosynnema pretiosum]
MKRGLKAHWVSLGVLLALLMGALSFHAYAISLPAHRDAPIRVTDPSVPERTLALVVHGGPHPRWTPRLLDALARTGAKATFHLVGARVNENPDLVLRMVAEGHEVGVESFRPGELRLLDTAFAQSALIAAAGVRSELAERDTWSPDLEVQDVKAIAEAGAPANGAGAVLRLHDTSSTPGAVEELRRALPDYRFTTRTEAVGGPPPHVPADRVELATAHALAWSQRNGDLLVLLLDVAIGAVAALAILRVLVQLGLAHTARRLHRELPDAPTGPLPPVSVVVPAYNEAVTISAAVRSLANSDYPAPVEVVVVDDGSADGTADVVRALDLPGVRVVTRENGGKARALNTGVALAEHDALVLVDGDTIFEAGTLAALVAPLTAPGVGAVSGNVKVANRRGLLGRWQHLEYTSGSNLDRQILNAWRCLPTIPGAVGAFRREALVEVGGVSSDTLAEDTDVTMAITRAGWRVVYEPGARAWTEVPAGLRSLYRQRYRWSYGTFQAMWKHRVAVREQGRMGRLGLLYLLLFHLLLPLLAPVMDVYVLYGALVADAPAALPIWLAFLALQTASAGYALRLDGESLRPLWAFPLQQLAYRQLTYLVVVQSLVTAAHGIPLRWQSVQRTGRADAVSREVLAVEGRVAV